MEGPCLFTDTSLRISVPSDIFLDLTTKCGKEGEGHGECCPPTPLSNNLNMWVCLVQFSVQCCTPHPLHGYYSTQTQTVKILNVFLSVWCKYEWGLAIRWSVVGFSRCELESLVRAVCYKTFKDSCIFFSDGSSECRSKKNADKRCLTCLTRSFFAFSACW